MKKRTMLKGITFIFSTLILAPSLSIAAITVPSCEKLKDFPLHELDSLIAYKKHDAILQEYFGTSLSNWSSKDVNTFVSTFVSCRAKDNSFFNRYDKNYFSTAVKEQADKLQNELQEDSIKLNANESANKLQKEAEVLTEQAKNLTITERGLARLPEIWDEADALWKKYDYTGDFTNVKEQVNYALNKYKVAKSDKDLQEKLGREQAEKNLATQESNAYDAKEAQVLLKKHGKIGPPPDFLASQFRTYAGAAISGKICTIIQFYDRLEGKKKWDKRGDSWVLTQKRPDHVTGEKHEMLYTFYDLRSTKGYSWLERLMVDKRNYPDSRLDLIVEMLFTTKMDPTDYIGRQ